MVALTFVSTAGAAATTGHVATATFTAQGYGILVKDPGTLGLQAST